MCRVVVTNTVTLNRHLLRQAPKVTLVALEYMNADYNLLPELPETVTTLTSLTELSLVGNRITQLPNGLFVLTNLVRINVRSNPITQVDTPFSLLLRLFFLFVCVCIHSKCIFEYRTPHLLLRD